MHHRHNQFRLLYRGRGFYQDPLHCQVTADFAVLMIMLRRRIIWLGLICAAMGVVICSMRIVRMPARAGALAASVLMPRVIVVMGNVHHQAVASVNRCEHKGGKVIEKTLHPSILYTGLGEILNTHCCVERIIVNEAEAFQGSNVDFAYNRKDLPQCQ